MEEEFENVQNQVREVLNKSSKKNHTLSPVTLIAITFAIVFFFLLLVKPFFLYENKPKKLSYLKLILYALIFSCPIFILYEVLEKRKFLNM